MGITSTIPLHIFIILLINNSRKFEVLDSSWPFHLIIETNRMDGCQWCGRERQVHPQREAAAHAFITSVPAVFSTSCECVSCPPYRVHQGATALPCCASSLSLSSLLRLSTWAETSFGRWFDRSALHGPPVHPSHAHANCASVVPYTKQALYQAGPCAVSGVEPCCR